MLVSAQRLPGATLMQLGATGTSGVLLVRCANAVVRCVDWYMHYRPVAAGTLQRWTGAGVGLGRGTKHEARGTRYERGGLVPGDSE